VDQIALDLTCSVLVTDEMVRMTLWNFEKKTVKGRWSEQEVWVVARTPEFTQWSIDNLRDNRTSIRREEIPAHMVLGGKDELKRIQQLWETIGRTHREMPMMIKRWRIYFSNEMDALIFKLRWVG